LGNFGRDLRDQFSGLIDEEEQRKKRLEAERQQRLMGGTGTAALSSVYGGNVAAGSIGGMSLGKYGL
jgi:hypothetical protein